MTEPEVSLSQVHRSVSIPKGASLAKRMFAFFGPAYLISVGYIDPGNWATDLEGGARFGYTLIWVLLMSNAMALVLQALSARLGIVTGRDLAQACRDHYPRSVCYILWILTEIAIVATDLAELIGTTIGLNLLFGIPVLWGVVIGGCDTLLLLAIQNLGIRRFEGFILSLVTIIGLCFVFEVFISGPEWGQVISGFVPRIPGEGLYIIIGIVGATVMPHNLYLHSALVQTRAYDTSTEGKLQACKYNLIDSAVALNAAFFINAAILVVAAAVFFKGGIVVTELQQAYSLLSPLLGTTLAGLAFAVALLCSGQASTLTGTLAGQIVMEGFLRFKIRPVLRRFITRMLAVIPAALTIMYMGDSGTYKLIILSQVILSLQLPFAVIPLIHFTSDRRAMGEFVNKYWVRILSWIVAGIIVALNMKLVTDQITEWVAKSAEPFWIYTTIVPFSVGLGALLLYITLKPFIRLPERKLIPAWQTLGHFAGAQAGELSLDLPSYDRMGVAVAFSDDDRKVLSHALHIALQNNATLYLFHVVESAGGILYGPDAYDTEAREDEQYLSELARSLSRKGIKVQTHLGYGDVVSELTRMVQEKKVDVLVLGGQGHRGISDLLFGSTITPVRHQLEIPVFVVR